MERDDRGYSHNRKIQFTAELITKDPRLWYLSRANTSFIDPIEVKITLTNRSDTIQKVHWPTTSSSDQKTFWFALVNSKGNAQGFETRSINMQKKYDNAEVEIQYLKPGEILESIHSINDFDCFHKDLACHHLFDYFFTAEKLELRAFYQPLPDSIEWDMTDTWKPSFHTVEVRGGEIEFNHVGSSFYSKERISDLSLAPVNAQVEIIALHGNYSFPHPMDGAWQTIPPEQFWYNAMGIVKNADRGWINLGDTVLLTVPQGATFLAPFYTRPKDDVAAWEPLPFSNDTNHVEFSPLFKMGTTYSVFMEYNQHSFGGVLLGDKDHNHTQNYSVIDHPEAIQIRSASEH